jgi:hypothetical protein
MARNVRRVGPALLGERIMAAVAALPEAATVGPQVRALLRSQPTAEELTVLLRRTVPPGLWPDGVIDDLLDPRSYLGVGDELVRRAVRRHRADGTTERPSAAATSGVTA